MPAAAAIPAVVGIAGAGASIYAANKQSDAAKSAAGAQTQAANQAAQVQREMYYNNLSLLRPFITTGSAAASEMAALMGLGGVNLYGDKYPTAGGNKNAGGGAGGQNQNNGPTYMWVPNGPSGSGGGYVMNGDGLNDNSFMASMFAKYPELANRSLSRNPLGTYQNPGSGGQWVMQTAGTRNKPVATQPAKPQLTREQAQNRAFNRFRESPDYQFRLDEGLDAVANSAAARGGLLSGAAGKAMNKYAQNLASSEYGNYWNRLAQLAGYGSSMISQAATLGSNTAGQLGQAYQNSGDARASGYINSANAFSGGLQGVGNSLGYLAGQYGGGGYTDTSGLYNSPMINGWS